MTFFLLYQLHKTIWIFHATRGNQSVWRLSSASHPSDTQLWITAALLIRMVLCPGWDLWKLFSSTSFPPLFHTSSRIMLKRTSISLVYQEMRRLSSSTQGESLLLLQKCQQKSRIQLQTNIIPFAFWISQYQCKLHQVVFAKKTELHSESNKSSTMSMRQGSTFTSDASHSWCCKFFLSFPFLSPFHFSTWCNSRPVPVHPSWRGWPELHQYLRWNIPEDLHRINTVFLCYSFRSILRLHTSQPHHISSSRYLL